MPLKRMIPVFVGVVSLSLSLVVVGCGGRTSNEDDEAVATDDGAALTQVQAYEALLGGDPIGNTFVMSAMGCGHSLTLGRVAGDPAYSGHFEWTFRDCDLGDHESKRGTFKIVKGWLDGIVSDPTLEITPVSNPLHPDDDTTPWSYKIRTTTQARGMMPKGAVYLESTSPHGAELIQQRYMS